MKPIYALGITLATVTVFGMIWYLQIGSAGGWDPALQREGDGSFYDSKRTNANVDASAGEASKDGLVPVNNAKDPAGYLWGTRLRKLIHDGVGAFKRVGHPHRVAPAGVFFTLRYISVRNPYGITGVEAGTRVVCVKDEGPSLFVKAGDLEFEAKRQYLTNDLDVADLAVRNDGEAQQAVESYIAQQQQATDQRSDKWKMQASRQY